MQKREIAFGIIASLLAGSSAALGILYHRQLNENDRLQAELNDMQKQVNRSAIIRNISTQMEQIAYQQKDVSDEQRIQAVKQTEIANTMRIQAEVARGNALRAQQAAQVSEARAVEASHVAERQQKIAEQQQRLAEERQLMAEYAQRVSDTLSYISLARSLGDMSTNQYHTGNRELAACLATVAYNFTQRYQGDVYQPSIFRALSLSCASDETWNLHQGALTAIVDDPVRNGHFYTVDTYGGIMEHQLDDNGKMSSSTIIKNKDYDFRDACISDDGVFYAVSRTGDLFVHTPSGSNQFFKVGSNLKRVVIADSTHLIVAGENMITDINTQTLKENISAQLPFELSALGMKGQEVLLFDTQGKMYGVNQFMNLSQLVSAPSTSIFGSGTVTAYAYSPKLQLTAYGTTNGDILLVDRQGRQQKLIGHRSRISQLTFHGSRLYSSSFDGTVNFWQTDAERIDPMNIHTGNNWIECFALDKEAGQVWTGDYLGNLSQTYISAPQMARVIREQLRRNLTNEEWRFYMGNNIPYETIK